MGGTIVDSRRRRGQRADCGPIVAAFAVLLHLVLGAGASDADQAPSRDLSELSLEELMNTEVTSVSRKRESRA